MANYINKAPKDTYTIEEFVEIGDAVTLSYNNLSYLETLSSGTIDAPIFNVIDDYLPELKNLSVTVNFSDAEYAKYIYKPKLLAQDIYNNTELYFIILAINGICDVKDFDKKKFKLIKPTDLNEVITYIYNANMELINLYNNR